MHSARYQVGSLPITVVSDGRVWRDAGAVHGLVPKVMWQRVTDDLNPLNQVPLALNCLLLESDGKTVLIETGQGDKDFDLLRKRGESVDHGLLLGELARLGVQAQDVDIVINTHLHSDHCGWNTRLVDGSLHPTFPRARYYMQRGEWDAATHPNERTRAAYLSENLTPVAEAGQLELIDGETAITSAITVIETPGHTADHASVLIREGGETAVYIGDLVQHSVQLERAAWISAFDVLPLVSLETKKRLVRQAVEGDHLIVAVHLPFPGVGRLHAQAERHTFVAEPPRAAPAADSTAAQPAPSPCSGKSAP